MGRQFGGRTPLGKQLNKLGSRQEGAQVSQVNYRVGTIVAFATIATKEDKEILVKASNPKADGLYQFTVRLEDGTETGFLPLIGRALNHADRVGKPAELLGERCLLFFQGPSSGRGKIIDFIDDHIDPLRTASHNQLQVSGAAFAPPGNGLI